MAYRGGGGRGGRGSDRGDQRPPYGHGGAGGSGGGGSSGGGGGRPFICPLPPSTPRPVTPTPYLVPVPMGYRGPMVLPHQGVYGVPMAVYRPSEQAAVFTAPAPAAPQVSFSPAPPAAPVTIRALPPSSTTTSSAATSSTPAPPRQPAPKSASTPAPDASFAPSPAALAKEVEKKVFVSETAAAAAAAVAAAQGTAAAGADDSSDLDQTAVSKKGFAHPARPGLATVGKKVFLVNNVADNNLFHYDVSINLESKSRQTNKEVLNERIKLQGKTALGGKLPARKSLYTAGSLPFESEEFVVTLVDPGNKDKERAEREYKITIQITERTDLYHLQQFQLGRQRDMPQETIQALDVVLRESPSWNYVSVSRSFFSTTFGHRGDNGEGLECWRANYQSLRPTQMGLSLNIDISATSLFKCVTVIKFVEEFLNRCDTSQPLSDRDRVKIKKPSCGVRIETTHEQDQIRRYKITGNTSITMSQLIFPVDDKGKRKTVVQYIWDKYGSWPCFQAGSYSRPVYLPMEVCIAEGQRYSQKLNDRQVTNILRETCKRLQEREQSIHDMVLHNKYVDDTFAQEFGIKVRSDLVTIPACVLPPPLLKYHDSGREKTCVPSVGQWNMINKKMINGGTIDNWTCLNFSHMRPDEVHKFCMDLTHVCNATGMVVNPCPFVDVKSAAPNHIENALRDVHRRATQMLAQQALRYMAYEEYVRWIILGFPNVEQGPVLDLMAGSIAGGTAVTLDLVRTKLSNKADAQTKEVYAQMTLEPLNQDFSQHPPCQELMAKDLHANGIRRNHVGWYKSTAGERQPKVSLWDIESLTTFPMHPSPFPLGLKHQWSTGLPSMHGGKDDNMANSLICLQESQQQQQSECLQVPHHQAMQQQNICNGKLKVQFFVSLGGRSLSTQQILEDMTVRELIEYCCQQIGIRETKQIYGVLCGTILSDEELLINYPIYRDSTVDLRSRLRGGVETYTTRFSKPDADLFYSVALPEPLKNCHNLDKDRKTATCVWKLMRCTRSWVRLILVFFTGQHRAGICYNGGFEKDDILFGDGRAYLRDGIVGSSFSGPGCKLDFKKLSTILSELKTSDGYYTQYFSKLLNYLKRCPYGELSKSDLAISFVINHPAIEYYGDRMKQVFLADGFLFRSLANRKTPNAEKAIIRKALGKFREWWDRLEFCPAMKEVLDKDSYVSASGQPVYNPLYSNDPSGGFHYSNNFLKHARKTLKLEEIEAAHSVNAPNLLPDVFENIIKYAIDPKNAGSVEQIKTLLQLIQNDLADPQSEHSRDN